MTEENPTSKLSFINWKIALVLAFAAVAVTAVVSKGKCNFVFGDGGVSLTCKDSEQTATKPDP